MTMQPSADELFAGIDELMAAAQYDAVKARLAHLHACYHDVGSVHLRIHLLLMRIARRQRDTRRIVGEILPVVFAVPTSLVQRYLGLALPGRMGNKGC